MHAPRRKPTAYVSLPSQSNKMRNPAGFKFNGIDKASALWTDVENAHNQPRLLTVGYSVV